MFKKIYYINLEHRTDRNENVENQLKKINFNGPIERINAAYGKNLDLKLIPNNLFTKESIQSTTNKNDIGNCRTMTKGGMGVSISQKWIYEKILCGTEDYALILEDDVTITDNFITKLEEQLKNIPEYDILWIGYHSKVDVSPDIKSNNDYYDIPVILYGLFGYIINKKAAKRLIEMFPITNQIDSEIPKIFPELKVYALKMENRLITSPKSQDASEFGSDIQFSREAFGNIRNNCDNTLFIVISIFVIFIILVMYKKN